MSTLGQETRRVLQEAREASADVPRVSSRRLEPVFDEHTASQIMPWRAEGNGHSHPLHSMMSRVGGFPPSLARYLVAVYSEPGDVVLDPFCGKGTALFEAASLGRRAIGGDIAPDAIIASSAKCSGVRVAQVANYIQDLPDANGTLLHGIDRDVSLFFHKETLRQIVAMQEQLIDDCLLPGNSARKRAATFTLGVLLGLLHGHSALSLSLPCNQCFAMSPNYVRKYVEEHGLKKPNRDVKSCLLERSLALLPGPRRFGRVTTYLESADACDRYMGRSKCQADLVLTSPPYLSRQTYLKDAWLRLWLLGHDRGDFNEDSFESGNVPYFLDAMRRSLSAIWDALRPGGNAVLVCGKANVTVGKRKRVAHVNDICLLAAAQCGEEDGKPFATESMITDRVLMKRGSYFAVHHGKSTNGNGKKTKRYGEDEVLVLRKDA